MALNIQGLTQEKIVKKIEDFLRVRPMPIFDTRREQEIFEDAILQPRVSEALRFTVYKRLFYTSSYNYFDEESSTIRSLESIFEYIKTYLKVSSAEYDGYLVKLFLPSSYHTVAIAKTLPYPVEFEMAQPLVVALKVKSLERSPTIRNFRFHIRPSVYYTKLYTNQLKNIGDCKEIGVYHEHKLAMSYPFEIRYKGINFPNVTIKYRLPELQKQIFTYFSEAGTYAGKKELEILPFTSQRVPITTQPTPFKFEKDLTLVGVPPLHFEIHTEDINLYTPKFPHNPIEVLDFAVRRLLNAGWTHKSMNVTLLENYRLWPRDTEVTLSMEYYREHVAKCLNELHSPEKYMSEQDETSWNHQFSAKNYWNSDNSQRSSDSQLWNTASPRMSWFWRKPVKADTWSDDLKPTDILTNKDPEVFIRQGRWAALKLITSPHIRHMMKVEISTKPLDTIAAWTVEYNHTYCKTAHVIHMTAAVKPSREPQPYEVTIDHVMVFLNKPNVFKYDTHKESQFATFISGLGLHRGSVSSPWENVAAVFKGKFGYQSLEELFKDELLTRIDPKYFLPETHDDCLKDIRSGQALSVDCIKAIRARSIYNQAYLIVLWRENLPEILKSISRRADFYTKHFLFNHLNLTDKHNHPNSVLVEVTHIDKFVDEPVFDAVIRKPEETVEFKRIPTIRIQPLSSVYDIAESYVMEVTNDSYPPTCIMMEKYMKTYDMKSYRFSPEGCTYVLSSHCAERKYFTITAKGLDRSRGTKEIHIYVGDNTLTLTPKSGNVWKIDFNGRERIIEEVELLDMTQDIYVYTDNNTEDESLLQVIARRAGIKVLYDGVNVKIEVDPRYKGEMCGLCSEFDGDELREYRGLDRCLYTHPTDFANSAITNRHGTCDKRRLFGEKICDDEESTMSRIRKVTQGPYIPPLKRNIVKPEGSEFCFSVIPVPMCEDNSPPLETETMTIGFHCLPRRDMTAKKLLMESKRRVLGEIASRTIDFEETIEVAKLC